MPLSLTADPVATWVVRRIGVIGPGIVGMPMAALLAHAAIRIGTDQPATVTVVQRRSPTSAWKVEAINAGRSPIGGVEPELADIVRSAVDLGLLRATHDPGEIADCDAILVAVQTDKDGIAPGYGPLFEALEGIATALQLRPPGNVPLIIVESTLAPSSMATVIRDFFAERGLVEGRDLLLGNSPNRVMPGRLVERVRSSDKIVAGLDPITPRLIERLYRWIVSPGSLHPTNSLTAEIVKTLENAYRDVRIAFAAELARFCDGQDIDFFALRERVNHRLGQADGASFEPGAIPSGGVLVPTIGVGGHCLPKDGVLLWWRRREAGARTDRSLILAARRINDGSPTATVRLAEQAFGPLTGRRVALLGAAYRPDSEDTRNSPTLALAGELKHLGAPVVLHDPYVSPQDQNLKGRGLADCFTRDLDEAVSNAEIVFVCAGHQVYSGAVPRALGASDRFRGLVDGCNFFGAAARRSLGSRYTGIGRGRRPPTPELIDASVAWFRATERGVANELGSLVDFLNQRYAKTSFEQADFETIRRLAGTCVTGCLIAEPGAVANPPTVNGFRPTLATLAADNDPL